MRIIHEILPYQLFKIAGPDPLTQCFEDRLLSEVLKRLLLIIQPAVEDIDRVDESLRESAIVCLAVTKLHGIDRCLDLLRVQAFLRNGRQRAGYDLLKAYAVSLIGILCRDGKDRLTD